MIKMGKAVTPLQTKSVPWLLLCIYVHFSMFTQMSLNKTDLLEIKLAKNK